MCPGRPIYWVSEGRLRHSRRSRPTRGAGQGPMRKASAKRSLKATASSGGHGCTSGVRACLAPWKSPNLSVLGNSAPPEVEHTKTDAAPESRKVREHLDVSKADSVHDLQPRKIPGSISAKHRLPERRLADYPFQNAENGSESSQACQAETLSSAPPARGPW